MQSSPEFIPLTIDKSHIITIGDLLGTCLFHLQKDTSEIPAFRTKLRGGSASRRLDFIVMHAFLCCLITLPQLFPKHLSPR